MNHRLIRRVLMVTLLLLSPLGAVAGASAADIKGALEYVPRDSFSVTVADIDKVKKSPLFAKARGLLFQEEPKAKKNLAKLKAATGFDPFRDVRSVVVAFGEDFVKDDDQFVIIFEATVNERRFLDFIAKEGGKFKKKTGPHGSYYVLGRKGDGRAAFRGKFLIMGGEKSFKKAMQKQGMNPRLRAELDKFSGHDVASVMKANAAVRKDMGREIKGLAELDSVAAGLNLHNGIGLTAVAQFLSAKPAQQLAKMANMGLDELKADKQIKKMGLTAMIAKIKVAAIGKKLKGSLKLSATDVNKLTKLIDKFL